MVLEIESSYFIPDRVCLSSTGFEVKERSFWDWLSKYMFFWNRDVDYEQENEKALKCFKKMLSDSLGSMRFESICSELDVDFDQMINNHEPLTTNLCERTKVLIEDVTAKDVEDFLNDDRSLEKLPKHLKKSLFDKKFLKDLTKQEFLEIFKILQKPLSDVFKLKRIAKKIRGEPSREPAFYLYDQTLSVKERLQLCEGNEDLNKIGFYEKLSKGITYKEMEVGTVVRAYNDDDGNAQFFRVAAKVVTGRGHVSFVLVPATNDTNLEAIRVYRGSVFHIAGLDTFSYYVTNFEKNFGKEGFLSAQIYEKFIKRNFKDLRVEMGHSLGGCFAEHKAVREMEDFDEIYLFNCPGIPKEEIDRFNKKANETGKRIKLYVIRTTDDFVDKVGEFHLGYKAPKNVDVEFYEFIPKHSNMIDKHCIAFFDEGKDDFIKNTNFTRDEIDEMFFNLKRSSIVERVRGLFGGYFLSQIFYWMREVSRKLIPSRAEIEKGLHIEDFSNNFWSKRHISEIEALRG